LQIGNVDILTVFPHDFPHKPTENTKRWAENIANLLTDEARITKTQDILAGAYCVEALTQEICENAWVFFQKIMAKGGVFHVDCRGFLENECAKNIAHIENNLKNKKTALVGVHIYPISKDAPPKTFTKDADVLSVYNEGWKIVFLEELGLEKH
jgi:methylmalonyl-CoA mutase